MTRLGIILGGGFSDDGGLPQHVIERITKAADHSVSIDLFVTSSRYTLNKKQILDQEGYVISEAAEMAHLLKRLSPNARVIMENSSSDTIGSGLFCRSLIDALGLKIEHIKLFTSSFHMPRALNIFRWAFGLRPDGLVESQIEAIECSGAGTAARNQREARSLSVFENEWRPIVERSQAWHALLEKHDNYNIRFNSAFRAQSRDLY